MNSRILPALAKLLCDPDGLQPVILEENFFRSTTGRRFAIRAGIPDFRPTARPLRHRMWEWVYNRTAFSYDFGVRLAWGLSLGGAPIHREDYLEQIDVRSGQRVLETAVGTGDNLLELPEEAEYIGVDISLQMLKRCSKKFTEAGRSVGLVQADLARLPFFSASFDVVLHMGGLQFLAEPMRGLQEMHRVAAHGGQVTVVDESQSLPAILRRSHAASLAEIIPQPAGNIRSKKISGGELFLLQFTRE